MRVQDILQKKGTEVVTLGPTDTIAQLVELLAARGIGAIVICAGPHIVGIASERDVVHALGEQEISNQAVSTIMSTTVHTCTPEDSIEQLARVMTEQRIRHMPVLADSALVGIISIGDVVKNRLDDLEAERDHLTDYLHS